MADTAISKGDALAIKYFSVALFAEAVRRSTFRQAMKGPVTSEADAMNPRMESSEDWPIQEIRDLQKMAGDTVSVDMFHIFSGKPTMGDRALEGREEPLTSSTMDVSINQYRHAGNAGGKMSQKRTKWDLRRVVLKNLSDWFARLEDQLCLIHMSGARGSDDDVDWCIPLDTDGEFDDIVVNAIMPPSINRYFVAGGGVNVGAIGSTDSLTLTDIDVIRAKISEMPLPPKPVRVGGPGQPEMMQDPLYVMYVTSRQWHYMLVTAKQYGNDWRTFLARATERRNTTRHPLFSGECGIWNGILIRKTDRAIRFATGDGVSTLGNNGSTVTTTNVPAGITHVDRAILLGGQALAECYGSAAQENETASSNMWPVRWEEEMRDYKNIRGIAGAFMGGKAKLRFKQSDDVWTDKGVIVIDSYAPDPASNQGQTLADSLNG